jgi:hypothetical protein
MSTLELENIKHPDNSGDNIALASNGSITIDRKSTDGTIAEFRKDGTAVGSIATSSGRTSIGSGTNASGVRFDGSGLTPFYNNAVADGTVDLGYSGGRFNNVYLSGGVYLGGLVGANKLDDYEDGSFNVTLATDTAATAPSFSGTGYYIKVGNIVHLHGQVTISGSSSGGINLHIPLPFVPVNMRGALTVGINQPLSMKPSGEYLGIIVELNIAKAYIVSTAFGGGHSHLGFNECGTGIFSFSGSYRVA